jgi:uncharacterized protein
MDYERIEDILRADGRGMTAPRLHGLISALVCVGGGGEDALRVMQALAAPEAHPGGEPEPELAAVVDRLGAEVAERLAAGAFEFPLMLPEDEAGISAGTEALGQWCDGFVFGIAQGQAGRADGGLPGPVAEVVRDMMAISEAEPGGDLPEDELRALVELQEYVKVAAQLVYEELNPPGDRETPS